MIFAIAVVLIVGALSFTLYIRPKDVPKPIPVSPFEHLDQRKAAIYENLRDLQFEYRVGKLSDADYQTTKLGLQRELAAVLAEIDKIKQSLGEMPAPEPVAPPKPMSDSGVVCPHCAAKFPSPMKFCGECGKPMGGAA